MHKICFTMNLFHASTFFEHHALIVRRSIQFYLDVLVLMYLLCLCCITNKASTSI